MKVFSFNKKELKIFLTFFTIYSIFIFWYSYYEYAVFDLTRAIVDEGRLEIDSYYNNTVDRSFYNNHYYSNKAPGLSFLASPIYANWKFIYNYFFQIHFMNSDGDLSGYVPVIVEGNTVTVFYTYIDFFTKISMILLIIFTSSLFTALTVLLMYKISKSYTKNEKNRILLIIIYGLGTLVFPYATTLYVHNTMSLFLLLSFAIIKKSPYFSNKKYVTFSGLASGYAFCIDYLSIFVSLFLFIYITMTVQNKKLIILFIIACILGSLPLLIHNYYIFGNPYENIYKYLDTNIWNSESWISNKNNLGFELSLNSFVILRLLFFPNSGLFFYYIILIISLFGLILIPKKNKIEGSLIILFFSISVIFISMLAYWWGGNFGARYLIMWLPFLSILIIYSLKKIDLKIISILLIISIITNLSSTIAWDYVSLAISKICCNMDSYYANMVNTFKIIANPIIEKNMLYLFERGPRSRLIESFLVKGRDFDIRNHWPSVNYMESPEILNIVLFTSPLGFVLIKVSLITTLTVIILIFLIWKKNAVKTILNHKYLFILLFLLFMTYFFNINNNVYSNNWFEEEIYNFKSSRWMSDNATISVYSPIEEKVKLQFNVWTFYRNRTMEVYLNNKLIASFNMEVNKSKEFVTPLFGLNAGENTITFHSVEGCDVPAKVNAWLNDYRCLSFQFLDINKITLNDLLKSRFIYENNWYAEEKDDSYKFRWISNNATIDVYSEASKPIILKLESMSYYRNRTMEVYLNDKLVKSLIIIPVWSNFTIEFKLNEGENIIKFHSIEGCDVPKEIEKTGDDRCLSFAFRNIKI